ncbi:MAG: 1-deoxy-D-xylulose-5-phosphate reductoisomerase [Tannerellaceae bacterium]|jgi:1-deoxy-D-xylulose-5-phosphate reductoisomerase|nr:1-deoxy-D-xylulose-5-phosphate reductoisomerase [Tannerellaceae bacterium]
MKRRLAILGSTGSIGTQALEVIAENPESFEVYALVANRQSSLLARQARRFNAEVVVIASEDKYAELRAELSDLPVKVWAGAAAVEEVVQAAEIDIVLAAMVGYAGLRPTMAAIRAGKAIALANKETLVVAGELITALAREHRAPLLPVDSEHSAIFQCLDGAPSCNPVRKIWLTASGGPFRTLPAEELAHVTKEQALRHPNWQMGAKVTVDSASLMNKGFEMIEARWLFDLAPEQIHIVVHPQSIIHSMVEFGDGAVIAQLGLPDMKLPIAYALAYPQRLPSSAPSIDFAAIGALTFEEPDSSRFRNLALAFEAVRQGGNMPCILNAANEIAVEAFLRSAISFPAMSDIIERTMRRASFVERPTAADYEASDAEARIISLEYIH